MMYFQGCPECKRKCTQEGDQYKCEHCNKKVKENTAGKKGYCQGHSIFELIAKENHETIKRLQDNKVTQAI